jgi:ketosteroid isomerase-like protein
MRGVHTWTAEDHPVSTATTDRSTANLATVTDIYAAFGRGDVPAILDKIAPNCRWESWENNQAQRQGVPTLQPRTGPAGVADFFAAVGELHIDDFQVLDMLAGERQVAVEVVIAYSTPAGGYLRDEELHLWTFDERQQVVRLRHYVDTAKHIAAFAGENTTA